MLASFLTNFPVYLVSVVPGLYKESKSLYTNCRLLLRTVIIHHQQGGYGAVHRLVPCIWDPFPTIYDN
jgi:hypothetical protein